jgi:hypothetical protein
VATASRTIFDAEYEAAMRRVLALPRSQQLRAYHDLRKYLGAELPESDDLDRQLERKAASLAVPAEAIEHLGVRDRPPLRAKKVDATMKVLGRASEWSSGKIVCLWRKWRFALEALEGQPPSSPQFAAMQSYLRGHKRSTEDYLTAVRLWLATNPPKTTTLEYEAWAQRTNAARPPHDPIMPSSSTVRSGLARGFPDIVRIARGEVALDDMQAKSVSIRADRTDGPDYLTALGMVARILNVNTLTAQNKTRTDSFPPVALELDATPVWVREDVEASPDCFCRAPRPPGVSSVSIRWRMCAAGLNGKVRTRREKLRIVLQPLLQAAFEV